MLVWVLFAAIALFWLFHAHGYDDPYITYRYAVNLDRGYGFVYNAGERVLSTTTPLYTLVLALLGLTGVDVPLASNAIGCLSLALGGLAFWRLGQVWESPVAGAVGLLVYPTSPLLIVALGAEAAFYMTLILFGFLACACERYGRAAVLLALATLTRADGVLAAAAAGLYVLLVSRHRPLPWRAALIYCGLLAPWFIFAWCYFGAPLPVTLAAKQHQALMANSRSFWSGLGVQAQGYWNNPLPFYRLHLALAAAGLVYGLARRCRWLLLVGWNALYVAGYTALGVTSYFWYYAPLIAGLVTLIALGVMAAQRLAGRPAGPRWAAAVAATLALALLAPQVATLASLRADSRLSIYRTAGEWLRTHSPPQASVGMLEVGIIGYYAERRIVDFAGLIQPETALRLSPGTTYEDSALWVVHHFHPDYLILYDTAYPRLEADQALKERCHRVETFEDALFPWRLATYACTW